MVTLAAFHEMLTSSLIDRSWFTDGITETELEGIKYLGYIADDSEATAEQVADMPWFTDGITETELEGLEYFRSLAFYSEATARQVTDMPWFTDGITETELRAIDNLAYIAQSSEGVAELVVDIPWFTDGVTETEVEGIKYLGYIAFYSEATARQVTDMPWYVDGITETELRAIDNLAYTAQSSEAVAELVVNIPWFTDDIAETELEGIKYLGYIADDSEAAAEQVADMPWFTDGITETELEGLEYFRSLAFYSEATARQVTDMPWFTDGITETELEGIKYLGYIANDNTGAAERISKMPFLTAIEPVDVSALEALAALAAFTEDRFDQVMAHPSLAAGITDALTPIVTMLYGVAKTNPSLIEMLLNPDSVSLERRSITLSLTGPVDLVIVRTGLGAARSMDLLEHSVRTSEELMGELLPTRYIGLLYENALRAEYAGTNFGTHITIRPKYDVDDDSVAPDIIAHEVAHYYWRGNAAWIDESIAAFMTSTVENRRTGRPIGVRSDPCAYARSITELRTLFPDTDTDSDFGCGYSLGQRLFVDMYRAIGEDAIWQGLGELYIESLVDDDADDLKGTAVNIEHLREVFQSYPGGSTTIARWYEGTEGYDLSELDLSPTDATLPSINGRIDEAYMQIGEDGPKVSSFSAQDVGEHTVWLNLDYSYNVTGGPHNVLLSFTEFYEDGFQFRRGTVEVTAEDQYTDGTSYIPVHPEQWVPGRYWVYIYDGDRKVAEVQYEVTP